MKRFFQSTYVDDVICGAETEDEAFDIYTQSKEIFRQGGFNLRKFLSNSKTLQTRIDRAEGLPGPKQCKEDCPMQTSRMQLSTRFQRPPTDCPGCEGS